MCITAPLYVICVVGPIKVYGSLSVWGGTWGFNAMCLLVRVCIVGIVMYCIIFVCVYVCYVTSQATTIMSGSGKGG